MAVRAARRAKKKAVAKPARASRPAAKQSLAAKRTAGKPAKARPKQTKPVPAKVSPARPVAAKPPAAKPTVDRKQIYLQKIEDIDGLSVWIVDGAYIRSHLDEKFTRLGQHYRFAYIPANELWLDRPIKEHERRYCIDRLLVEHRLMAKGVPYAKAFEAGGREERKERRRAGDVGRISDQGRRLPAGRDVHLRLWKRLDSGVSVWIVNGRLVRSVFDGDYAAGGHDYVYEFVPEDEIWIDDQVEEQERGYVLLHELHERNRMAQGWPYSRAHAESSRAEYRCRHHPEELQDRLAAEGWA